MAETMLSAQSLSLFRSQQQQAVLDNVSINLQQGDFHMLLGPNGAGKSTLLKILSGDIKLKSSSVELHGKNLNDYSLEALAHERAVLPQLNQFLFPMTVYEVCALGRTPYMGSRLSAEDKQAIDTAITQMELESYCDKDYANLSGGEQQRVQIARVLCQETPLLFLDEPLSALDIRHQIKLLNLLQTLTREGKTILCVMHDINLALQYASQVTFLKQGRVMFQGKPEAIESSAILEAVYDIKADLLKGESGVPQIQIRGTL